MYCVGKLKPFPNEDISAVCGDRSEKVELPQRRIPFSILYV